MMEYHENEEKRLTQEMVAKENKARELREMYLQEGEERRNEKERERNQPNADKFLRLRMPKPHCPVAS